MWLSTYSVRWLSTALNLLGTQVSPGVLCRLISLHTIRFGSHVVAAINSLFGLETKYSLPPVCKVVCIGNIHKSKGELSAMPPVHVLVPLIHSQRFHKRAIDLSMYATILSV